MSPEEVLEALPKAEERTPIERRGRFWAKRDDLYEFGGVRGGKVRSVVALVREYLLQGLGRSDPGIVTAASRTSRQGNSCASVARALGWPSEIHLSRGELLGEMISAEAKGAQMVKHQLGTGGAYLTYCISQARKSAEEKGWCMIPFGMESEIAVFENSLQAENYPAQAKRIVVPAGSGISLAGVLRGMRRVGDHRPVLGVAVGHDPAKKLKVWAPEGWEEQCELRRHPLSYEVDAADGFWEGIELDRHYEAKCIPFLEPGDLLVVVGVSTATTPGWGGPEWRKAAGLA